MRFLIPLLVFLSIPQSFASELPRYNEVYQAADHNAYWIKRTSPDEIFASGTQTRISDQLLFHHARSLEIDIHKDLLKKGEWKVYHTSRTKNSFCETYRDCLRQLKMFHLANPNHEVITIVTELKQIFGFNFDAKHTPEDLDKLVQEELGPYLFQPKDLMEQCPRANSLRECMASARSVWPRVDQLRGKFIFTLLGNWRYCFIGHGSNGWATYGTVFKNGARSIRDRVYFPMETDFLTYTETAACPLGPIPNLDLAKANSIFLQVEKLTDAAHLADVSKLIANGEMVRGGDSFDLDSQKKRLDAGFHFLQTDYPWIQYADAGPDYPFRRKDTFEPILEPGTRYFQSSSTERRIPIKKGPFEASALIASARTSPNALYPETASPNGTGCLFALGQKQAYKFCRRVDLASQRLILTSAVFENGKWTESEYLETAKNPLTDWIKIKEIPSQNTNEICVSFQNARITQKGVSEPTWVEIGKICREDVLGIAGIGSYQGDSEFLLTP